MTLKLIPDRSMSLHLFKHLNGQFKKKTRKWREIELFALLLETSFLKKNSLFKVATNANSRKRKWTRRLGTNTTCYLVVWYFRGPEAQYFFFFFQKWRHDRWSNLHRFFFKRKSLLMGTRRKRFRVLPFAAIPLELIESLWRRGDL